MPVNRTSGFTLVEVLVISPIIILFIGAFITLIVSLTGESIQIREKNAVTYDTQTAFDDIESGVARANGFLYTTGAVASPQGSNNGTNAFTNDTADSVLIMTTAATTSDPNSASRALIYTGTGACDSRNPIYSYTTVYFLALDPDTVANTTDKALYRRTILPQVPACATAWQKGSCAEAVVSSNRTICKTSDEKLLGNVATFNVSFYNGTSSVAKENANTADSVSLNINSSKQVSGSPVSYNSTLTTTSQNITTSGTTATPAPLPSISWTRNDMGANPYTTTFPWQARGNATSYTVTPTVGGVVKAPQTIPASQTSFDLDAGARKRAVSIKLDVTTASGSYTYGTQAATATPSWNECTPYGGWQNYDGTYNTIGFTKTSSGAIGLKGLIRSGPLGNTACYLPAGFRTPNHLIFNGVAYDPNGMGGNGSARIDIYPDGAVIPIGGSNTAYTNGFVSLDGIIFMPGTAVNSSGTSLSTPWTASAGTWVSPCYYNSYGGDTYPNLGYWKDDRSRVWVQGLATGCNASQNMANLPSNMYPTNGSMHYPVSADNRGGAVNIGGNISSRPSYGSYISTQLLYNSGATGSNLPLYNGWYNYNNGWALAQCYRGSDDIVILQGLVAGGNQSAGGMTHIGGCGYMSTGRRALFSGWKNWESQGRLDLPTDGYLYPLASDPGWTSLDGIHYIAD